MIVLIMAGGIGSRRWPMSTKDIPKHFIKLFDNKSMLRLTFERISPLVKNEDIYIVSIESQVNQILSDLPELTKDQIIIEPCAMNTAPCIALSILTLAKKYDSNETMLVLPADHYISETQMFQSSIKMAVELSNTCYLITFGIKPTYPATGYGYIETRYSYNYFAYNVSKFVEKPSYDKAVEYLKKGNYYWNSGMFCFRIDTIRNSFYRYQETLMSDIKKVVESSNASERYEIYSSINKMPIDIAIFEKADNILVLPVSFPWSDVGNWNSLSEILPKDVHENYVENEGYFYNSFKNNVFSKKRVALLGVSDLVIVETDEAILVMNKSEAENVKNVVFGG